MGLLPGPRAFSTPCSLLTRAVPKLCPTTMLLPLLLEYLS